MSQEEVYKQFDSFDFDKSEDFKSGLYQVFESYLDQINQNNDGQINEIVTEIPVHEKERLIMQAKVFFFCSATGEILNIEDYEEWKITQANKEQRKEQEPASNQEVEYSSNYQQIVKLILEGKQVPGIKKIPDTVLTGESSKSEANQRRKPWEIVEEDEPIEEKKT